MVLDQIWPRATPLLAPLSDTEVLITGGERGVEFKDGYVFNLNYKSV